ncbi:hypothetical protein M2322_004308 [Rhodoblastus acidophilus]|uniref:hypothetical protein n=1 Tax=Rhodoblastus acidophilus TaxID=1074 RepID=UPI00222429E1|nr:hypothetical protein [Rhodoblastus acidophilus]MCW2318739.1 hypothetical protein [Rhodoblastus acidophilus]
MELDKKPLARSGVHHVSRQIDGASRSGSGASRAAAIAAQNSHAPDEAAALAAENIRNGAADVHTESTLLIARRLRLRNEAAGDDFDLALVDEELIFEVIARQRAIVEEASRRPKKRGGSWSGASARSTPPLGARLREGSRKGRLR